MNPSAQESIAGGNGGADVPARPGFAVACVKVSKSFGGAAAPTRALQDVGFQVQHGTIHALVGENGAGKSTLNLILSGLLVPDSGRVEIHGSILKLGSPLASAAAGIGMVHQHFLLAEALSVAENVALGRRVSRAGLYFDRRRAERDVAELAAQTGLAIDPRARVADLPVGMRQRVEVLKALARGAKILLLDEPTAVLAPPEVETLFATLRQLRDSGRTIVLVTHKLDEVFAVASAVTVLRRGRKVFSGPLEGLNAAALAEKMIGAARGGVAPSPGAKAPPSPHGGEGMIVLEVRGLSIPGLLDVEDLSVRAGEIAGIAGVEGNGQTELANAIAGIPPNGKMSGVVRFLDRDLALLSIKERSEAGIGFIPSDRQREALILELSLAENLFLRRPLIRQVAGLRMLDRASMAARARELLDDYGVTPADSDLPALALSGGNQQKVVLARELSGKPRLILAHNPTRGLDVGAAAGVCERLQRAAREEGAAVLLISAELDELLALSDTVHVFFRGRLTKAGNRGVSRDEVGRAMAGAANSPQGAQGACR